MIGRRTARRGLATIALVATAAAGCAEDVSVSRNEAIEVLVLDGVSRERAECIVDGADGVLSFAKVTGVDAEISEDELADLARVSASCVFVDDTTAGVIGNDVAGLDEAEGGGLDVDIEAEIERLVSGGLGRTVAECVGFAISVSPDPAVAAASDSFLAEAIRSCEP
ncbi:MAG: hypothetical protein AAGA90_12295 [Actinomycetota bacterium]